MAVFVSVDELQETKIARISNKTGLIFFMFFRVNFEKFCPKNRKKMTFQC
ncbi:hypothetical protein NC99_33740 [Sunxiuqinia dokdonensis]|uniref:Uncharacterized protein n=1 Tax=Sunxiuqinia dokdonensis TaxID=1409788 RepID=A0A0L8V695_9BACT|nr:hypothetical protein NC99_33740 [Sunxiuqinia dokdonensis]